MCGIAGIFLSSHKQNKLIETYKGQVENILASQKSRGPDYQKTELILSKGNGLILGHNRLSIVDLNATSNQPMWDETQRFCIAYNGMLYNYVEIRDKLKKLGYTFFSLGDTEVVLKALMHWGAEALSLFNGMFAIAFYDTLEEKLYLIRDRFGVKPLFYIYHDHALYFASTSSVLAKELSLKPNLTFLARGIHYWCYDSGADSVYENLLMVPPGEQLMFQFTPNLSTQSRRYYNLSSKIETLKSELSPQSNYTDQLHSLLEEAIRIRLRADVNMGISLSGGIDSSMVASLAVKNGVNLSAFTFGTPNDKYSEAETAVLIAKKLNIDLHFISLSPQQMIDSFWQTLDSQEAPFPNFSIVAQHRVFKKAHEQGVKVMLGGQGGDEIFMGYRKYLIFYLQQLMAKKNYVVAFSFLVSLFPTLLGEGKKIRHYLFNLKRYSHAPFLTRWKGKEEKINLGFNSENPLWHRQLEDITTLSLPTLLRYEDRNSMGNSIESRLPFLDYRLVELALALPERLKIHRGYGKWALREIASRYIPQKIAYAKSKRGFDVNTKVWIDAGVGRSLRGKLYESSALLKEMGLNNIEQEFSDARLANDPLVLSECIALCWLCGRAF